MVEMYAREAAIALQRYTAEEARRKSDEIFCEFRTKLPAPDRPYRRRPHGSVYQRELSPVFSGMIAMISAPLEELCNFVFPDRCTGKQIVEDDGIGNRQRFGPRYSLTRTYLVRCKDSTVKDVIVRAVILSGGTVCVICEDLTERNKAEQTHRLLSSIIASTSDAVFAKNNQGTIISWNKAAEHLYGYSEEEMIGQNISRIIPADRTEEMEKIFSRIDRVNPSATWRPGGYGKTGGVSMFP